MTRARNQRSLNTLLEYEGAVRQKNGVNKIKRIT